MTARRALLLAAGILLLAAALAAQKPTKYALPIADRTPGVVDPSLTADLSKARHLDTDGVEHNICAPDFKTPPFRVATKSQKIKTAVCKSYGIDTGCPGPGWELDDLVPIEVGGMNIEANLWPQPIAEARVKDHRVEDLLGGPRGLVCQGKISLQDAQRCVRADWVQCMTVVQGLTAH